jgi:hypothetical protein
MRRGGGASLTVGCLWHCTRDEDEMVNGYHVIVKALGEIGERGELKDEYLTNRTGTRGKCNFMKNLGSPNLRD